MAIIMDNQTMYVKYEIMLKSITDGFLFVVQQPYNVDGTRERCSDKFMTALLCHDSEKYDSNG